jgi:hypothetical protein
VVVELFFVGMAEARVEEAFIAVLAAIGAQEPEVVKEPLQSAASSRAVKFIAAAMGAKERIIFNDGFAHKKVLSWEGLIVQLSGERLNV